MSPEVIKGSGHNEMSDWWGLGITLFELVTGSPPYSLGQGTDGDIERLAELIKFEDMPARREFTDNF